jgi:predicted TIM-barrel fold metal-dependent hydrolase
MQKPRVIDGDGHIFEDPRAISSYLPSPYREAGPYPMTKLIPAVDHLHTQIGQLLPGAFAGGQPVGPDEWIAFLAEVGIESTVLYPTDALGYGRMVDLDWSVAVCRAYNEWLSETYVRRDARFHGMALVPLQEPAEAVKELRRAVTELSLSGAFLPSNGLPLPLGAKPYWPLYAEAERLGCALAVHGGNHSGFGMDYFNVYAPVHSLGHPFGQLVSFASIVFNGVFDKYPGVRIAFLEGGIAWLLLALERFDRSYETHIPYDPRKELIRLRQGQSVEDYIKEHIRAGRIFVGCEGEESDMPYLVARVGVEPFFFSSDYPHEVNAAMCQHEIEEVLETPELNDDQKAAILHANAERLYGFTPTAASRPAPVGAGAADR